METITFVGNGGGFVFEPTRGLNSILVDNDLPKVPVLRLVGVRVRYPAGGTSVQILTDREILDRRGAYLHCFVHPIRRFDVCGVWYLFGWVDWRLHVLKQTALALHHAINKDLNVVA